ncbi:MAG: hypothetical protein FJ288_09855 [Planctomycetes bacterium]|nr:hypothetical protein [Planctomycetota bacterium]
MPQAVSPPSESRVVLLCRDPGRKALLARLVPAAETHTSAVEALLAVARRPARAVVVNLDDADGTERDLVAALRRARPETAVYLVVGAEDEPRGRLLLRSGIGDYFVLPTDVYRLPRVLAPAEAPGANQSRDRKEAAPPSRLPEAAATAPAPLPHDRGFDTAAGGAMLSRRCESMTGAPPEPVLPQAKTRHSVPPDARDLTVAARSAGASEREEPGEQRLFEAACALAGLADARPEAILREGAAAILHGLGAAHARVFTWDSGRGRLDLAAAAREAPGAGIETFEDERTAAERAVRTGETLFVEPGGLVCLPLRADGETLGALCLARKGEGAAFGPAARDAAAAIAGALARLYLAAVRREQFAALALRDAETGLLREDALGTYLAKLLARAAAQKADVAVVVLAAEGARPAAAEALPRLGREIASRLPKGWQGARLSADRFAIVGARRVGSDFPPALAHLVRTARVGGLVDLGAGLPRLRAGLAESPRDGADAEVLLAAAEERLGV